MSQRSSFRQDRRQFLKLAGIGSAAGAAAMAPGEADAETETRDGAQNADYRETDHVRTFYRMARF